LRGDTTCAMEEVDPKAAGPAGVGSRPVGEKWVGGTSGAQRRAACDSTGSPAGVGPYRRRSELRTEGRVGDRCRPSLFGESESLRPDLMRQRLLDDSSTPWAGRRLPCSQKVSAPHVATMIAAVMRFRSLIDLDLATQPQLRPTESLSRWKRAPRVPDIEDQPAG